MALDSSKMPLSIPYTLLDKLHHLFHFITLSCMLQMSLPFAQSQKLIRPLEEYSAFICKVFYLPYRQQLSSKLLRGPHAIIRKSIYPSERDDVICQAMYMG